MIDPAVLETVSVPLALEDAVPVLLSAVGFVLVARGIGRRLGRRAGQSALVAAVAIGLGGMAKVSWKVIAAGFERDVTWLDALLFPLLSVGMVGMLMLLNAARRPSQWATSMVAYARGMMIAIAVLLGVAMGVTSIQTVGPLLLPVAASASLVISWHLIAIARRAGDAKSAAFLVVNVVATLALAGLARAGTQTLALQWVEQSINTVSQGLFLLAALRLAKDHVSWGPVDTKAPQPAPVA